jgi:hypothetical protein
VTGGYSDPGSGYQHGGHPDPGTTVGGATGWGGGGSSSGASAGASGLTPSSGWIPRVVPPPTPAVVVTTPFDPTTAPAGYYVDCTAGDDAGPGTATAPWRTLAAFSRPVVAGTAIFLRRGCQWDGGLTVTTVPSPTATSPAVTSPAVGASAGASPVPTVPETLVAAYGPGVTPVLSAVGLSRANAILEVAGSAVTVRGLHVAHAAGFGVNVTGANALLDGIEVDDVGIGIRIQAPFATVTGGVIHDLHMYNNTPGGDDDSGAVGFDVEADDATIAYTSSTHCRAPSYDYGYDGGFVDIWRHGNRLQLVNNTGTDIQGFLEIGGLGGTDSAFDVIATGNVITDTHTGVWVHGDGTFAIATGNIVLDGNTFTTTDTEPLIGGTRSSLVLRNNTFTTPGGTSSGS